jgi:hypothetical protein
MNKNVDYSYIYHIFVIKYCTLTYFSYILKITLLELHRENIST